MKILVTRLSALIAPELKAELVVLSSTGNSNILLDISDCEYCDDAGLSAILTANRLCKNSKGVFVLAGVNSIIDEFISLTQADKEINIAYNIKIADQVIKKLIEEKQQ
ncbi:MAG: STAS domain-containing protein [Candidatus Atribacteria bacterium]|nr:STAS domain-containing protein [Candidatus Atribacteria bacterium]